mgnify:CR=1 FL=1
MHKPPAGIQTPKKPKLWTRDFALVTVATAIGCAGGIAGEFALSFLVFDETGSTLASALVVAIQLVPHVFVPLVISPVMDRLPRKAFLVLGDIACGLAYMALGLWLLWNSFSYVGYLVISLAIACLQSIDGLAWTSIYPEVIPEGAEQQGYAVSSMLFTTLTVIMAPFAAVLLDVVGVPMLLVAQGVAAVAAALIENLANVREHPREQVDAYTFATWASDIRESLSYLRDEGGLRALFTYMAVSNGMYTGYTPVLIAFFRTTQGFSVAMYALFSVADCMGRTLGSAVQYRVKVPKERRFGLTFLVYQVYDLMDACLLWIAYPLMLANRALCGFLGGNSYIMREAAMQRYIPEQMRSRVNAFSDAAVMAASSTLAMAVGAMGEVLDYRLCLTVCGLVSVAVSWLVVWRRRTDVRKVFEAAE